MTELEALRGVAEAARAFFDAAEYDTNMSGGDWGERMGPLARAMEYAFGDLDALPTPAAEPVAEVVEVVAAVGRNPGTGLWSVRGWSNEPLSESQDVLSRCRTPVIATIRARVPLPRVPEVVGEVG